MEKSRLWESTGVYQIRNLLNGKMYIGSTSQCFRMRKNQHFNILFNNTHHSRKLQHSYNKHGVENFVFEILEECSPDLCVIIEQKWFDKLKPHITGYNILPIAGSCRGTILTQEHKDKISASESGKVVSEESRRKMSNSKKGIGLGVKRGPFSEEHKKNISLSKKNKVMKEETKIKISKKLLGRVYSVESIERMSKAGKGKVLSEETKEKLRQINMGKVIPTKIREKISIGVKLASIRRRLYELMLYIGYPLTTLPSRNPKV